MIAIDLQPEIERRLALLAEKTGQSAKSHVEEALLDHLEDFEDGFIALERLQNPGRIYSAAEVKRELGL